MRTLRTDMMMMLRKERKIPMKKIHLKKTAQWILKVPTEEHHMIGIAYKFNFCQAQAKLQIQLAGVVPYFQCFSPTHPPDRESLSKTYGGNIRHTGNI